MSKTNNNVLQGTSTFVDNLTSFNKEDIIIFKVYTLKALSLLRGLLSTYVPYATINSLNSLLGASFEGINSLPDSLFPLNLALSGFKFYVVSDEFISDNSLSSRVSEVRERSKVVVHSGTVVATQDNNLDIYPKFKRADWNSFGTVFNFETQEDYLSFLSNLEYNKAEPIITQSPISALVKDGIPYPYMVDSGSGAITFLGVSFFDSSRVKQSISSPSRKVVGYSATQGISLDSLVGSPLVLL